MVVMRARRRRIGGMRFARRLDCDVDQVGRRFFCDGRPDAGGSMGSAGAEGQEPFGMEMGLFDRRLHGKRGQQENGEGHHHLTNPNERDSAHGFPGKINLAIVALSPVIFNVQCPW